MKAFKVLKTVMATISIVVILDFNKMFVVEMDAFSFSAFPRWHPYEELLSL